MRLTGWSYASCCPRNSICEKLITVEREGETAHVEGTVVSENCTFVASTPCCADLPVPVELFFCRSGLPAFWDPCNTEFYAHDSTPDPIRLEGPNVVNCLNFKGSGQGRNTIIR